MSMSVTTNIASLNAQNNLAMTQSKLNTAIERLSSGLRINSAKDDAAGLAISTRFTTQINGLNQAVRNANDAISMAQTSESALNEVTNNLQRIRQLSVQSATGTNSATDRAALDKEVQQRLAEITRIAQQTNFNGTKVLDGSAGTVAFQVGSNVGEIISADFGVGIKAAQIGQIDSAKVTGEALTFTDGSLKLGADQVIKIGTASVTLKKDMVFTSAQGIVDALNAGFRDAGVGDVAQASVDAAGKLSVSAFAADIDASGAAGATGLGFKADSKATHKLDDQHLSDISITTVAGANEAMRRLDAALQTVSDLRSNLGAVQNRFQSTIANLQTIARNLDSSRSQIMDVDFAAEVGNSSRAQILQQAGVSVLAQANASQQGVLKLLQ